MTKQELIKILDEKIENAEREMKKSQEYKVVGGTKIMKEPLIRAFKRDDIYKGNIQAYTDIKKLLENEVLENETRSK